MKKLFIIINIFIIIIYFNLMLVFLPPIKNYNPQNSFNLTKEDSKIIKYYFTKNNKFIFKNFLLNNNIANFLKILKNKNHPQWFSAYLFLLTIMPELIIKDDSDC